MPGRGRGGRGGHGGRGRGRGRGRRHGGSHGRSAPAQVTPKDEWDMENQAGAEEKELDINTDVNDFFVGQANASFDQHYKGQEDNRVRYAAAVSMFLENSTDISQNARVRGLAAAWARRDHELADAFLANRSKFGLVEVLKAVTMLDAAREIRAVEKVMRQLQMQNGNVKPKKIGKLKSRIDNLTAIKPKVGSASGAVCSRIKRWTATFTKEELEFFALFYPAEPWRCLADICHFNPEKDFPALPWFLSYCFGKSPPEGSMVARCKEVTAENVNDLLKEFDIPYSHIKKHLSALNTESKTKLAAVEKIDTVLWYYEDLHCQEVDTILEKRLAMGEKVTLNNGKLLERLLTIKIIRENIKKRSSCWGWGNEEPPAEKRTFDNAKAAFIHRLLPEAQSRLDKISLPLEAPIVVIGDRSASMDVAIRTSTIIASILTAIAQAKLVFFNTENMEISSEQMPRNVESILEMAVTMTATGGTAPAASLYPFYESKEIIKTFIIVTDEEENQSFNGYRFAQLYKKYHDEVYNAKLVFVSFLRGQHAFGQMVTALDAEGFHPLQVKLESGRPDLAKLDSLFGLLSAGAKVDFEYQLKNKEAEINEQGVLSVLQVQGTRGQILDDPNLAK